jgi:hypothetical protein
VSLLQLRWWGCIGCFYQFGLCFFGRNVSLLELVNLLFHFFILILSANALSHFEVTIVEYSNIFVYSICFNQSQSIKNLYSSFYIYIGIYRASKIDHLHHVGIKKIKVILFALSKISHVSSKITKILSLLYR